MGGPGRTRGRGPGLREWEVDGRAERFVDSRIAHDVVRDLSEGVRARQETLDPAAREIRRLVDEYEARFSSPSQFSAEPADFMSGGNRTHNQKAHYLAQEVQRILERDSGVCFDPAEVRRQVHDELARHKINDGREHNTNVLDGDFREIIDHVVAHFGGRVSGPVSRVIETSEDMHWRIEDLIEGELAKPENAALWEAMDLEGIERLRATIRTRLRAEFSSALMNEWGSERLEDVSDFLRQDIVVDFELQFLAVIAEAIGSSAVCEAGPRL